MNFGLFSSSSFTGSGSFGSSSPPSPSYFTTGTTGFSNTHSGSYISEFIKSLVIAYKTLIIPRYFSTTINSSLALGNINSSAYLSPYLSAEVYPHKITSLKYFK